MNLPPVQLRVLGSLLEKEATTPDTYPLSLNALAAACNQLSNRDPVMELSEIEVRNAVNALRQESLVRAIQPAGSKVMKFQHLLTDTLNLDARERAVLCVLLLRGPQTLAEIRARTNRLAEFGSPQDADATIAALRQRDLATEMPRRPGQKEARYAQLLGGPPGDANDMSDAMTDAAVEQVVAGSRGAHADRIAELESTIDEIRREIAELRERFEDFQRQF
ncbi:MAG TPA: YceH family protein [Gemmatimonadaceae bacterium]|jgi:hypothetical protein|nr:YceH family protein [Gemmatimonadaceae bacterium]